MDYCFWILWLLWYYETQEGTITTIYTFSRVLSKSAIFQGLSMLLCPPKQGQLNCCCRCARKSANWLLFLFSGAKATFHSAKFPHQASKVKWCCCKIQINELLIYSAGGTVALEPQINPTITIQKQHRKRPFIVDEKKTTVTCDLLWKPWVNDAGN